MAELNSFKSETLQEQQDRMRLQTELENKGMNQAQEGQVVPVRTGIQGGEEQGSFVTKFMEAQDILRVQPSAQDIPDEQSVEWTKQALQNPPQQDEDGAVVSAPQARLGGEGNEPKQSEPRRARRKAESSGE